MDNNRYLERVEDSIIDTVMVENDGTRVEEIKIRCLV